MPDVPDRAVEAAKVIRENYPYMDSLPAWDELEDYEREAEVRGARTVLDSLFSILTKHEATQLSPEQFIDGLTDAQIKDLLFVAGLRAAAKKDLGYGPEIRAGLKHLIPTPEGKK